MREREIIIGIIMMMLMIGCNNGGESSTFGGLSEIGRNAENTFYSFISLITDTLGLKATKETTKNDVGNYYKKLAEKIEKSIEELLAISGRTLQFDKQSGKEVKESDLNKAIEKAKQMFEKLKEYIASLGSIGDSSKVGEVPNTNKQGVAVDVTELKKAYTALKGIVNTAVETGVEGLKESKLNLAQASIGGSSVKDGAKVLTVGAAGGAAGPGAATIVSSVSGEEILAAIIGSSEGDESATISQNVDNTISALKFAKGGATASHLAQDEALAGAVSGGIALRSLVKGGKLASHNSGDDEKSVQSAGITAMNKLLGAVEEVIKKTVKNVLEKVKQEVDKARAPKTVGHQ